MSSMNVSQIYEDIQILQRTLSEGYRHRNIYDDYLAIENVLRREVGCRAEKFADFPKLRPRKVLRADSLRSKSRETFVETNRRFRAIEGLAMAVRITSENSRI
jgi:hypothetical protein